MIHALLVVTILAQLPNLDDLTDGVPTAAEASRHYQGGHTGATPIQFVPVWVYVDGQGLGAAALQRLKDAFQCNLAASPSQITRLICRLGDGAGQTWKASGNEWLGYFLVRESVFKKLKWYDDSGAQAARIKVFAGKWSKVAAHARCDDFLTVAQCAAPLPPVVYAGIDPNLGDDEP